MDGVADGAAVSWFLFQLHLHVIRSIAYPIEQPGVRKGSLCEEEYDRSGKYYSFHVVIHTLAYPAIS